MRLHGRGVDEHLGGRTACSRKGMEEVHPHALGGPADVAVVERLVGSVEARRINPARPDLSTWMMPLITRRSSTRGLPRVSVGRCGSIVAICSSVSQKRSIGSSSNSPESHPAGSRQLYG